MNAAQRRHYDAIQQLARDEWSAEDDQDSGTDSRGGAEAQE